MAQLGRNYEMDNFSLISLFGIALVASFGHCVGMCGGIVLAYCGKIKQDSMGKWLFYHLLYNFGRLSTYVVLGGIVGFLGSIFAINATLRGVLFIFAGVMMILAGFSLFGKIRFLAYFESLLQSLGQKSSWYQKSFQYFFAFKNPLGLYLLGILNGLLPCGLVYSYLFSAAGFGNVLMGMAVMATFGLGTIPALLGVAFVSNVLMAQTNWRKAMMNLAAMAIILFGAVMAYKGVRFVGYEGSDTHQGNHHEISDCCH